MKTDDICSSQNRLYALTVSLLGLFLWFQLTLHIWITPPSILTSTPTSNHLDRGHRILPYLLNDRHLCRRSSKPSLIIFVASAPGNLARRNSIRETWANREYLSQRRTAVRFLLGRPQDLLPSIETEHAQYGDLIQTDFADTYMNLTLKSISALQWTVDYCPDVNYVMKTDDDVFVNVGALLRDLDLRKNDTFIRGCLKGHVAPPLRPKQGGGMIADPRVLGGHPPFAAGAGYVISGALVRTLLEVAMELPIFPIEDVFITARCARGAGVVPQHDSRFSCGEKLIDDCQMGHRFTGHWVSPDRQMSIWKKLTSGACL